MDKVSLKATTTDVLQNIDLYSIDAVLLLLGTCAQESAFGRYRVQIGGGPGLGIMQMEPFTHDDCWSNYLNFRPQLAAKILKVAGLKSPDSAALKENDRYAIAMARVKYLRDSLPIPSGVYEQAKYWKRVYNTHKGKGTVEEFVANYNKYVS